MSAATCWPWGRTPALEKNCAPGVQLGTEVEAVKQDFFQSHLGQHVSGEYGLGRGQLQGCQGQCITALASAHLPDQCSATLRIKFRELGQERSNCLNVMIYNRLETVLNLPCREQGKETELGTNTGSAVPPDRRLSCAVQGLYDPDQCPHCTAVHVLTAHGVSRMP